MRRERAEPRSGDRRSAIVKTALSPLPGLSRRDAGLLLDVLKIHRDKLRRLDPDTAETCTLRFLVEERRKLVQEKTRYSNRLTADLKMYFPQVLLWFEEVGSNIAAEFLERWPCLEKLQRAKPTTIQRFFTDHHRRDPQRIAERLEQIRQAVPATTDGTVALSSSTSWSCGRGSSSSFWLCHRDL